MKQIYRPNEIAKILQVSETTVLKVLPDIKEIKTVRFGRITRIDKVSFDLWFNGRSERSNDVIETYTPKQIADILEIKLRNVYERLKTTDAFRVIRFGRTVRVHKASFDNWFA